MVNDDFNDSGVSNNNSKEDTESYENIENVNIHKEVKFKKREFFSRDTPQGQPSFVTRARVPRGEQVLGKVEQRYGGAKMLVKCSDGKSRNCRVPGRMRRKLWLREGNTVLVEPWQFDKERGDVIFKYTPAEIEWLRRNGFLKADVLGM